MNPLPSTPQKTPGGFMALPQEVVDICASYIAPPELTHIATYWFEDASMKATEVFERFTASYDSPDTWDWQHGIDPRKDEKRKGTGRKAIEDQYRELNAHAHKHTFVPIESVPSDPFEASARLQGHIIDRALAQNNWSFPVFVGSLGNCLLLQTAFSPVYDLSANGTDYVLSKRFYRFKPVAGGNSTAADCTRDGYERFVHKNLNVIYTYSFGSDFGHLYRQHGGFQNLETLKINFNELIKYLQNPPRDNGLATATATAPLTTSVNSALALNAFQRHFRNVMSSQNESAMPFVFDKLRAILKLAPSQHVQSLVTLVCEEIMKQECTLVSRFNMALCVMDDFVRHLLQKESQSGGGAFALNLDKDENTQSYLAAFERFFKGVVSSLDCDQDYLMFCQRFPFDEPNHPLNAPVENHPMFRLHQAKRDKIWAFFSKLLNSSMHAPSCQATCTAFMLVYNEIGKHKPSVNLASDLLKGHADAENQRSTGGKQAFAGLRLKENVALIETIKPLAIKEKGNKYNQLLEEAAAKEAVAKEESAKEIAAMAAAIKEDAAAKEAAAREESVKREAALVAAAKEDATRRAQHLIRVVGTIAELGAQQQQLLQEAAVRQEAQQPQEAAALQARAAIKGQVIAEFPGVIAGILLGQPAQPAAEQQQPPAQPASEQ